MSISTTVVLGKRKTRAADNTYSLRLSSSPAFDAHTESEYETEISHDGPSTSSVPAPPPPRARKPREKRYICNYEGCNKAYTKPCRLDEHKRSHTGDRPFVCNTCNKSYLREAHLQAHARSHLPASARPLSCDEPGCDKRFWTAQHLRVHSELHQGERPFKCTEPSCGAAFLKHHQLRDHVCSEHAPPGTKPYRCEHPECTKSFATAQKLRTHVKIHDDKRYTCVHNACLLASDGSTNYFSTWTALQQHIRAAHPPTCPHPDCKGKTFRAQRGLRAHLKLHEQREAEGGVTTAESDADDGIEEPPPKRRRGGELGRDWICQVEGCDKDFKSKKALTNHTYVNHLGRRDFVCPHERCKRAFGYRHLLHKHLDKLHKVGSASEPDDSDEDGITNDEEDRNPQTKRTAAIDDITGKNYATRAQERLSNATTLQCPHPHMHVLLPSLESTSSSSKQCDYVFSRAYDLRRHLRSEHGLEVEKEAVDEWVKRTRRVKSTSQDDLPHTI